MVRAKKMDEKRGATLQIEVDSFVRTRDSGLSLIQWKVVTGLQTLQDAIRTLSSAYIKHTNAILGEHGAGLDVDATLAKLGDNPLLTLGENSAQEKIQVEAGPIKKERKKRQHDPNAPKRPLTPFFLYMQTARPIIANDLGSVTVKGAVGAEGQRRWQTMAEDDKQLWTDAYKDNLRLYHARIHSYKAGNLNAKEMDDNEANQYAAEHDISIPEAMTDVQLLGEATGTILADEIEPENEPELEHESEPEPEPEPEPELEPEPEPEPEPEDESTLPQKTPKPKSSRKSKQKTTVNPTEAQISVNSPSNEPKISSEKVKNLEKKRKRGKKTQEINENEEASVDGSRTAPKQRKKKAKND
ncbi:unnamed protein product [Blumeria hordei]|uniref:HMG box domain-containing protein n=1 Tax=Blumeria hordei TaxID=2867405 RepID=A0A383UPA1_BLUHO|nr:unnamed protein product [Blumeria hordei]